MSTIFYSWQSDLPNSTNRGFIETALRKAVKELAQDPEIIEPPGEVDRDTFGIPGSPDIAATILKKIEEADACVFDVSIALRPEKGSRVSPNPNVLVELGYALKAHASEQVILVFNTAFGDPEELPFDLRSKRVLSYCAHLDEQDRGQSRADLVGKLTHALKLVYEHMRARRFESEERELALLPS